MVKLKDISEECKVSIATVSKALSGQTDIGEQTSTHIREVASRLGYLPNANARALKTKRSHNIGVLFVDRTSSGLRHEYFSVILDSLKVEAESLGYDITFISHDIGKLSMSYYGHAKYRNCDGVVLASVDFQDLEVVNLVESEIPTVILDHVFPNHTIILSDNDSGMRALTGYVISCGHRKIAYIHGEDTDVTRIRLEAFKQVCQENSIDINPSFLKTGIYHDPESSRIATAELLSQPPTDQPTCIIYPDDFSFLGGMNEIERRGLRIPEDISVVGYDGINLSQVLRPKLTTYAQDAQEIGKQAARKLIENIDHPDTYVPKLFKVEGHLVEGNSVLKIAL